MARRVRGGACVGNTNTNTKYTCDTGQTRNTNTNTNTKYTCDTRNKLLAQWVHLTNHLERRNAPDGPHTNEALKLRALGCLEAGNESSKESRLKERSHSVATA